MKHFVDAARKALHDRNWYAALAIALILPDICGRIENPNQKSMARFINWFKYTLLRNTHTISPAGPIYFFPATIATP
jgi:hypothetical protein